MLTLLAHGHRVDALLKKYLTARCVRQIIEDVFKPANLEPDDMRFSIWSGPFRADAVYEREFSDEASDRLKDTFGQDRVRQEYRLPNGCLADCVILENASSVPRVLLEFKRPVSGEGETGRSLIHFLANYKQLVNYGSQILFVYPEIALLPIILTDGRTFLSGYGRRNSLASVEFRLCETRFVLYTATGMGTDFGLFWSMCSYTSPKCTLDVVVKQTPTVTVRARKCIGHGISSFVYEASVVVDVANEKCPDPLYAKLKAIGAFAIKILKVGQERSWHIEKRAFKLLEKKQLLHCCASPIFWDSFGQPFVISPLGIPAAPTVDTRPGGVSPLKTEHFSGLLADLCAIHEAGLVHRDIRPSNILIMDDDAKLIDFGYATAPTISKELLGTLKTASQAVLAAAIQGHEISYRPEDDLESLLKVFILHMHDLDIDYEEGKQGILAVFEKWGQLLRLVPKSMSYAVMKAYMEDVFSHKEEAWVAPYKATMNG